MRSFRGVWGASCASPTLTLGEGRIAFNGDLVGSVEGAFVGEVDRIEFRSGSERDVSVTIVPFGPDALHVRNVVVDGLTVNTARPILLRCSLRSPV